MTLDPLVEADILATCNALGSEVKGEYHKGPECLNCLKDILRYLKRDDENHGVLRCLGSVRLLQTDLLPILKKYHNDPEIFDFTLRTLVALTTPALILYKEELPDDKFVRNEFLQLISYLQSYKTAFIDVEAWKVLFEHLKVMLNMRPLERSSDESLIIERIIILVRNILHVPPDESILKQTDYDSSVHDKVLLSLRSSNIDALLLYMCANQEEHQYCMHLLEIVFLVMREHNADALAVSNETRSESEKQKDIDALQAAREREQRLKQKKLLSECKPRFNGVYCIKNMKSISDNDLIRYKYVSKVDEIHFDSDKNARRKPKNRARAPDIDNTRQSTLEVRLFLKHFCREFLKAYNKLMVSVKRALVRKISDEHDETYYFWGVRYFMQFNRLCDFQPALVSETVSTQTFHHIQTEITNYQEMMLTDKKKQKFWARRMQLGVGAYKELLETLRKMERSSDEAVRNCADTLIGHIFYVIEYRELLLSLITHYDEVKFPLSYLAELIESAQLFLKMLENHSKKHSEIVVQQKQRKIRRRTKKKIVNPEPVNEEELLPEQWDAVVSDLSDGIKGEKEVPEVTAFDATSEMTFEEQKVEAVFKIRESIIANKPLEALGLLRAARDLWPEGDTFGAKDIDPESELKILKDIHFSNLKRDGEPSSVPITEEASDEEDEETECLPAVTEKSLNIDDVYRKYATPKVIMPCSTLLANYRSNKPETNMCLIKLLHRIAWNCKMHALFFQSTIFLTFQKIFHDPDSGLDPAIKELYRFARFIMQKFFAAAETNKKIFVELLFWKGSREAYEIEEGYDAYEHKRKGGWTEDEEDELKYLYEEYKDVHIEGQDVADIILANFNKKCTKRQIISALKRIGLIKSAKDLKPEKRSEWLETEILDLQHLFEDFKETEDVMGNIMERLSIKRSRKAVVDKLLELNLIQDRKEVRKRKSKKNKPKGETTGHTSDESDQSSNSSEDEVNSDEDEANFFNNLRAELDNAAQESGQPSTSEKPFQTVTKAKKPPKAWDEQEVMELILIFTDHSDSDNLMGIIHQKLTVKRKDKDIIQKLLELGLIKNKNELNTRTKNLKKAKKQEIFKVTLESDNDESDASHLANDEDTVSSKSKKTTKRNVLSDDSSSEDYSQDKSLLSQTSQTKQNTRQSSKKRPPKMWEEQEVTELTFLFHSHEGSNNIMQDIHDGLTIKRPKNGVIEKLLELGLIKDKKEVRKKRERKSKGKDAKSESKQSLDASSGKEQSAVFSSDEDIPLSKALEPTDVTPGRKNNLSKFWDEGEIMAIHSLFSEYQDSDDVVGAIFKGLTVKRPKPAILNKLLELGLIKDKKELSEKRDRKTKSSFSKPSLGSNYDSDLVFSDTSVKKKNRRSLIESESSDEDNLINDQSDSLQYDVAVISKSKGDTFNSVFQPSLANPDAFSEKEPTETRKNHRIKISSESSDDDQTENRNIDLKMKSNSIEINHTSQQLAISVDSDANVIAKRKNHRSKMSSESSNEHIDLKELDNSESEDVTLVDTEKTTGKRKRVVFSSDESGDEKLNETVTTFENEGKSESKILFKTKLKKKFVLDDSDDSS